MHLESPSAVVARPNPPAPVRSRRLVWGLIALALVVIIVAIVFALPLAASDGSGGMSTVQVARGPLLISVSEAGTIRPREQIVLKNELDDPATIVHIVDEGTQAKKGDLLVELDVSARAKELVALQIRVQSAEAALVFTQENLKITESQSQADVDAAELAHRFAEADLTQYMTGLYPKLLKEADAKITIAEEELTRAQETLNWSNTLFEEKYISKTALQQDELAMKKAQLAVELTKADLDLLKTHTHPRSLATFESAVKQTEMTVERTRHKMTASMAQAEADLKAKKALLESERAELEEAQGEVAKAKIVAPIDGMVLYASSVSEEWDDDEPPIKEGVIVDERGEIIYLPTTGAFNVDTRILEANLRKIRVGHSARVRVDAIPGRVFPGKVTRIAPLPDQQSRWLNPNLKLYNTDITIDNPDVALRNGMGCRVEILVDEYADAVHVPIQCVTRMNGRPTVHLMQEGRPVPHPVEIGMDNGRFIHVLSGLQGGEVVALTPPLSADDVPKPEKGEDDQTPDDAAQQPVAEQPRGDRPPERSPAGGGERAGSGERPGGSGGGQRGGDRGGSSGGANAGGGRADARPNP